MSTTTVKVGMKEEDDDPAVAKGKISVTSWDSTIGNHRGITGCGVQSLRGWLVQLSAAWRVGISPGFAVLMHWSVFGSQLHEPDAIWTKRVTQSTRASCIDSVSASSNKGRQWVSKKGERAHTCVQAHVRIPRGSTAASVASRIFEKHHTAGKLG